MELSEMSRRGLMLVLSSPSGAGKTTIAKALLDREPNLTVSVSATTRAPRPGEVDGKDYRFVQEDEFHRMVARGQFLEHAHVFDHHYGTPRAPVDSALDAGHDVLFDIDWQGHQQLAENAREDTVGVFILPPGVSELEKRLTGRGQDSAEVIAGRMAKAADEMSHWCEYDYVVVNQDLEDSIAAVQAVLRAERLRRFRQQGMAEFVNTLRGRA